MNQRESEQHPLYDVRPKFGLTNERALQVLEEKLFDIISSKSGQQVSLLCKVKNMMRHHHEGAEKGQIICRTFLFLILAVIMSCCISVGWSIDFSYVTFQRNHLICGIILLSILGALDVSVTWSTTQRRKQELYSKAAFIVEKISTFRSIAAKSWDPFRTPSFFPDIHCPTSECVSLQWTYRNGRLINLPWLLLVQGDHILLRPGKEAPCRCSAIDDKTVYFEKGQVYANHSAVLKFNSNGLIDKCTPLHCEVLETPAECYFRDCFNIATHRPPNVFQYESFATVHRYFESIVLPIIMLLCFTILCIRYFLAGSLSAPALEMFLFVPTCVLLPLTLASLPPICFLAHLLALAKVLATFHLSKRRSFSVDSDEGSIPGELNLFTETNTSFAYMNKLESSNRSREEISRSEKHVFLKLLTGHPKYLTYSASIVQTLANATNLGVVDKKGILSWPNPVPEKVFVFETQNATATTTVSNLDPEPDKMNSTLPVAEIKNSDISKSSHLALTTIPAILDLTHVPDQTFAVSFDSPQWKNFLSQLKPLGLNILLNSCKHQSNYSQFIDHLTVVSEDVPRTLAVVNRRCLCSFSRTIGFTSGATLSFNEIDAAGVYRRTPGDHPMPGFKKHRTPLPCLYAVVAEDTSSGHKQMFCQGTADLVVEACSYCWDGRNLRRLNKQLKKKIADFYQRSSMTAYCLALSYTPLSLVFDQSRINQVSCRHGYVEWQPRTPKGLSHFKQSALESQGSLPRRRRYQKLPGYGSRRVSTFKGVQKLSNFEAISLDSLLSESKVFTATASEADFKSLATNRVEESAPSDSFVDVCLNEQVWKRPGPDPIPVDIHEQVLLGLISMQYQAKPDVVTLIEQLDSACIRFVHFSKENELRSRVFAEKIGLEAGWNCHISLSKEGSECLLNETETTSSLPFVERSHGFNNLALRRPNSTSGGDELRRKRLLGGKSLKIQRKHSLPWSSAFHFPTVQFRCTPEPISPPALSTNSTTDFDKPILEVSDEDILDDDDEISSSMISLVDSDSVLEKADVFCRTESDERTAYPQHDKEKSPLLSGATSHTSILTSQSQQQENEVNGYMYFPGESAKLPKGIENVRYHIDAVDNVPLLVPLFTDCTTAANQEMVQIMQDYGEVVCVLGSSLNAHNATVFSQANLAIAVQPILPSICYNVPAVPPNSSRGPLSLANLIASLPCSIVVSGGEQFSLLHLISMSRHIMCVARAGLLFVLLSFISLSLIQILPLILLMPPILHFGHVIWLSCFVLPAIMVGIWNCPLEKSVLEIATKRNGHLIKRKDFKTFCIALVGKFLPSMLFCLLLYKLVFLSLCRNAYSNEHSGKELQLKPPFYCAFFGYILNGSFERIGELQNESFDQSNWGGWAEKDHIGNLLMAQNFVCGFLVLYFITISMTYVNYRKSVWRLSPLRNRVWCCVCLFLLIVQIVYASLDLAIHGPSHFGGIGSAQFGDIPYYVYILGFVWPVVVVVINEALKYREIKLYQRDQRRRRLSFDTKLGMNSPWP